MGKRVIILIILNIYGLEMTAVEYSQPQKEVGRVKPLEEILTLSQRQALAEIRRRIDRRFLVDDMILFGSTVRGEAGPESDIDLLVLTNKPISRTERHQITDDVFEVNLAHNTNFSTLVVDNESWEHGSVSVLPIREEVIKEGVRV